MAPHCSQQNSTASENEAQSDYNNQNPANSDYRYSKPVCTWKLDYTYPSIAVYSLHNWEKWFAVARIVGGGGEGELGGTVLICYSWVTPVDLLRHTATAHKDVSQWATSHS